MSNFYVYNLLTEGRYITANSVNELSESLSLIQRDMFFIPLYLKNENDKIVGIFIPKKSNRWLLLYDIKYFSKDGKHNILKYPEKVLNYLLEKNVLNNIRDVVFRAYYMPKYVAEVRRDIYLCNSVSLYQDKFNNYLLNQYDYYIKSEILDFKSNNIGIVKIDFDAETDNNSLSFIDLDYNELIKNFSDFIVKLKENSRATNFYVVKDKGNLKGLIFKDKIKIKIILIDDDEKIQEIYKNGESSLRMSSSLKIIINDVSLSSLLDDIYKRYFEITFMQTIYPKISSIENFHEYVNYTFEIQYKYYSLFNQLIKMVVKDRNKSILLRIY